MAEADAVFVPSEDTARRLATVFPRQRFTVRPHEEQLRPLENRRRPDDAGVRRILVIGAIGPAKGSSLMHALGLDVRARGLPLSYHLVGWSDIPDMMIDAGIELIGRYESDEQALAAIAEIDPHLCLMPSLWPETYCYAMTLAMASRIPVVAFDIGAPADRLKKAGYGSVRPLHDAHDPVRLNDYLMGADLDVLWSRTDGVRFAAYETMLGEYYGKAA